jgi:esterase/lipase
VYTSTKRPNLPMIIYSHTFSGNKIEGKFLLEYFLPNYSICLFDFHACGNAEGEFVTLGLREKHDLEEVLLTIEEVINPPRIYLWGRSMGAVSIIHLLSTYSNNRKIQKKNSISTKNKIYLESGHYSRVKSLIEKKVKAVVLDSPFTDAYKMIEDILKVEKKFSGFVSKLVLFPIRKSIESHVKIDVLGKNKPITLVDKIAIPALFMIGEKDTMVNQEHYKEMFDRYGSEKKGLHYLMETDHSDCRNYEDLYRAFLFINGYEESAIEESKQVLVTGPSSPETNVREEMMRERTETREEKSRQFKPQVQKPQSLKPIERINSNVQSNSTLPRQDELKYSEILNKDDGLAKLEKAESDNDQEETINNIPENTDTRIRIDQIKIMQEESEIEINDSLEKSIEEHKSKTPENEPRE